MESSPTVADSLRTMIINGGYGPGARLGQTELATHLRASRVPVREALKMLTAEGLIQHDPNRGFFVAHLSSDEASQLFRLRELVEEELLTTVEWPSDVQLADIEERSAELETLVNAGKRKEWQLRHRQFHEVVFNLSPRKIFVREAMRLWSLTDRYWTLLPLPKPQAHERQILDRSALITALKDQHRAGVLRARGAVRRSYEQYVIETLHERGL